MYVPLPSKVSRDYSIYHKTFTSTMESLTMMVDIDYMDGEGKRLMINRLVDVWTLMAEC